jgi:uncharacterized membrane protein YoaK (UPF0700 family)
MDAHGRASSDFAGTLMRDYLARKRDDLEHAVLALVLPFVAGAVNASGFFIVGVYTSHVSGSVARIGDEFAQGHIAAAASAAMLVLAFFCGATVGTALVEGAPPTRRARYAAALACEAGTLIVVTVLGIAEPKNIHYLRELTTALLCFSMGAQNALVTRLSGAVVRTTHLTGIVTDLGIETVRLVSWLKQATGGDPVWRRVASAWRLRRHVEMTRWKLHFGIFSSFLTGAVIGPWLYLHHGYLSMLCPIAILLCVIAFDCLFGFRFRRHAAPALTKERPLLQIVRSEPRSSGPDRETANTGAGADDEAPQRLGGESE